MVEGEREPARESETGSLRLDTEVNVSPSNGANFFYKGVSTGPSVTLQIAGATELAAITAAKESNALAWIAICFSIIAAIASVFIAPILESGHSHVLDNARNAVRAVVSFAGRKIKRSKGKQNRDGGRIHQGEAQRDNVAGKGQEHRPGTRAAKSASKSGAGRVLPEKQASRKSGPGVFRRAPRGVR